MANVLQNCVITVLNSLCGRQLDVIILERKDLPFDLCEWRCGAVFVKGGILFRYSDCDSIVVKECLLLTSTTTVLEHSLRCALFLELSI